MNAAARFPDLTTAAIVVLVVLLPLMAPLSLASEIAVFATATLSVTLLLGAVGLLSFGQGLYFGFGAYTAGVLLRDYGLGLLATLTLAALGAAALGGALGALAVRRRGVYFVMLTLGFAQMGYFAMLSMSDVTGGENGLTGMPRVFPLFGWPIASPLSLYVLTGGAFVLIFVGVQRLIASPLGSVLAAIRENEGRSEAMGYDVRRYKTVAVALAGAIAGLAGALHAILLGFVPPSDIELDMSQRLLVMSIIGGAGSPAGALIGAGFYTLVSEALSQIWARWMALIALILIAIVLYLPGGLWSLAQGFRDRLRAADG
ncbi:MAG: branched-chain amino acid ABC transporter permease [Pseudomonadota bacterium]|nr:branched-chain amino acid ABC transporter permease [Pseudomonadota bacterium]